MTGATAVAPPGTGVVVSGAATATVCERLAGSERPARVVHAGPDAVYVEVDGWCVGVLSVRAAPVPCGIRTSLERLDDVVSRLAPLAPQPPDGHARVGGGLLRIGGMTVRVGRILDASVPRVREVPALPDDPRLDAARAELGEHPLALLHPGDPRAVPLLLGRGSGLTPLGDDVLAGWVATRVALRRPTDPLVAEVARRARSATTLLSATLLDCAARGEVLPQFAAALTRPDALSALLRVGHTSGAGLALGMAIAGGSG